MYEDGLGGDRDIQKAADMYKRAADEGRSNGHFCYACSVLAGHLPGVDRAVGFPHLLEACKQGNQLSLTHLMRLYLERDRDTFEVSQEEVLKLAMFGAKTGHTLSLLVHVAAYWRGDDYEQDRIMAYRDLATHLAIHLEDPDFNAEAIVVHLEELRAEFSEAELDAAREAVAEHATFEVLLILAHIYYRRMGRAQMPSLQPDEEESDRWIEVFRAILRNSLATICRDVRGTKADLECQLDPIPDLISQGLAVVSILRFAYEVQQSAPAFIL